MNKTVLKLLLVEDNPSDACLINEILLESNSISFNLEIANNLNAALESIRIKEIDLILLDLHLSDSRGIETFIVINNIALTIPIIILSGMQDEELAEKAISKGAQDYLVKGRISADSITRSIRYSIERKKREEEYSKLLLSLKDAHDKLQELSLTDPLTGLCNRRGLEEKFFQYIKMAKRNKQHAYMFFIDIDNMKKINDELGHNEGDAVLKEVASILKKCFRDTDITTRLGGDEFCVLVTMMNKGDQNIILKRLQELLNNRNASINPPQQPFSFSIGGVECDIRESTDLKILLDQADKMMYLQKGIKKNSVL